MLKESQRAALRAVLGVTAVGTAWSCASNAGGRASDDASRSVDVVDVTPAPAPSSQSARPSATEAAKPAPSASATVGANGGATCLAVAEKAAAAQPPPAGSKPAPNDAVVACCRALADERSGQMLAGTAQGQEGGWPRGYCCALLGWKGSAACTPWGPPMPRSIDLAGTLGSRSRLDLRALAKLVSVRVTTPDELRAPAIATWRARMINEHGSARVFEALAEMLASAGFAESDECASFAVEERRHGVLCAAVVEALGGEACGESLAEETLPLHADAASLREAVLRNVLSVACLHETVAVSLIGAERYEMPEGELRELLTTIWSDEIGHARFGWRFLTKWLPLLDGDERAGLDRYLASALVHLDRHELAHLPEQTGFAGLRGTRELGLCDGADARVLFRCTLEDVIVPRLEALGLKAGRAHAEARQQLAAVAA
jgi:hypothetical protein